MAVAGKPVCEEKLFARINGTTFSVGVNHDAVPVDDLWLHRMSAPLLRPGRFVAVQGGIRELEDRDEIFYWHSCGPRFYFTGESRGWIERHGGLSSHLLLLRGRQLAAIYPKCR